MQHQSFVHDAVQDGAFPAMINRVLRRLAWEDGQVVVLVALMLVVLIGFAGLAIDVSGAYAAQRFQRNVADAASLAGAQDLQTGTSRALPTAAQYRQARRDAVKSLLQQLSPSSTPPCANDAATLNDIVKCRLNTGYEVSVIADITAPAPTCVQCDPQRAVQVHVNRLQFGLALARIFGFTNWNVSATSVAGMVFPKRYGLVTLRPPVPLPNGTDQARKDVDLSGTNTIVTLHGGDVGTNTSAFTNSDSMLVLDPGYKIYHIDDITPDPWNKGSGTPPGELLHELVREPTGVSFPAESGLIEYPNQVAGEKTCTGILPTSLPYQPGTDPSKITVTCYGPGIYDKDFDVKTKNAAFLDAGLYIFKGHVDVDGYLFGGLVSGQPGVTLVLRSNAGLDGQQADGITLNYGDSSCADPSCRAKAGGGPPASLSWNGVILTIMVRTDDTCFVAGSVPRLPHGCTSGSGTNTGTSVVTLTGNGILQVAGVIWAPTDNVKIASNFTSQAGTIGEIISWTVTYSGGSELNEEVAQEDGPGILRLDTGCSPGASCVNP
jgi:hypothetical protein